MGTARWTSWRPASVTRDAERAALDEMKQQMETVILASQAIVPLNKVDMMHRGTLQRSAKVTTDAQAATAAVGFPAGIRGKAVIGSYSVNEEFDYAELQHENLSFTHEAGRQAEYLSSPFRVQTPRIISAVRRNVKDYLRWRP